MIVTRVPYRLSLFGGGTDYPRYYLEYGGAAISVAIDKYCTISLRSLPHFFDYKFRVRYHINEEVRVASAINHPVVRHMAKRFPKVFSEGFELVHHGDLPAKSGIGSSSAFTNAVMLAFQTLDGTQLSSYDLALETLKFEQDTLKENVGSQDQLGTAIGGFKFIQFERSGAVHYRPYSTPERFRTEFEKTTFLVFTGVSRFASDIAKSQIGRIKINRPLLDEIKQIALEANVMFLNSTQWDAKEVGRLLSAQWKLKKELDANVVCPEMQGVTEYLEKSGAYGLKLLGAGGGGFFVLVGPPNLRTKISKEHPDLTIVPLKIDFNGAKVIFNGVS